MPRQPMYPILTDGHSSTQPAVEVEVEGSSRPFYSPPHIRNVYSRVRPLEPQRLPPPAPPPPPPTESCLDWLYHADALAAGLPPRPQLQIEEASGVAAASSQTTEQTAREQMARMQTARIQTARSHTAQNLLSMRSQTARSGLSADVVDTRALAAPSYKVVMSTSPSDIELAYALQVTSQRFQHLVSHSLEVRSMQGVLLNPAALDGVPSPPAPRERRVPPARKILWSIADSKRAAQEHAEAERDRLVDLAAVARQLAPPAAPSDASSDVWGDSDDEPLPDLSGDDDHCGCSCLANRFVRCWYVVLRATCGGHWRILRSPTTAERHERAVTRLKVRRILRNDHRHAKSMV